MDMALPMAVAGRAVRDGAATALSIEGVDKRFDNKFVALHHIDLDVRQGDALHVRAGAAPVLVEPQQLGDLGHRDAEVARDLGERSPAVGLEIRENLPVDPVERIFCAHRANEPQNLRSWSRPSTAPAAPCRLERTQGPSSRAGPEQQTDGART